MSTPRDKKVPKQIFFPKDMPEYVPVEDSINTPPPYMDPANSAAHKLQKQRSMTGGGTLDGGVPRCKHCGSHIPQVVIWPAPRPADHIKPDNKKFIGYVLLIAVVIFLLFAACKYLP